MLEPSFTRQFQKDFKRARKRGKNLQKLDAIARALVAEEELEPHLRDHALMGDYAGRRECHIEPDWLLIYKVEPPLLIFERTGTHADLFGK